MKTVQDLIDKVGGAKQLAILLDLHQFTVQRWLKSGVPQYHWSRLIKLLGVSANELFEMTEHALRNK